MKSPCTTEEVANEINIDVDTLITKLGKMYRKSWNKKYFFVEKDNAEKLVLNKFRYQMYLVSCCNFSREEAKNKIKNKIAGIEKQQVLRVWMIW